MLPIDRALALHQAGDLAGAETIYRQILSRNGAAFDATHMLGVICAQREHYPQAEHLLAAAIAIEPEDDACLNNYANVLVQLQRPDEALAAFDRALSLAPDNAAIHCDRGRALKAMARLDHAMASFKTAVTIDPAFADAHLDLAVCRLLTGDLAGGWTEYEWRWQTGDMEALRQTFQGPLWLGDSDISGKTILVQAEQGLGDAIQFARYAKLLAARGARVIWEARAPVMELIAGIEGVSRVVPLGAPRIPEVDCHCPMMSLPLAFGTRLETIPAAPAYIHPSAARVEAWSARLGPKRRPRIGIVWSGSATNANEPNRAIGLERLLPLRGLDVELIALQSEMRANDQAVLETHRDIRHIAPGFADTAALISLLDLVVTVDTSIAHLAGAVGAPTFLLLSHVPDWRWLRDGEASPWYPSLRLFRQPAAGDWEAVVELVLAEGRALFGVAA